MAANKPPVRVLDGVRIDVPTAVVPVHVDRAQHTSDILDVEDVGVAVVQEDTSLTLSLCFHQGEHLRQGGFDIGLATEFSDDGSVCRGLLQSVVPKLLFSQRFFDFIQELGLEIFTKTANLDGGILVRVDHKLLTGHELQGGGRHGDQTNELEDLTELGMGHFDGRYHNRNHSFGLLDAPLSFLIAQTFELRLVLDESCYKLSFLLFSHDFSFLG